MPAGNEFHRLGGPGSRLTNDMGAGSILFLNLEAKGMIQKKEGVATGAGPRGVATEQPSSTSIAVVA
jgi:hypothetical protein